MMRPNLCGSDYGPSSEGDVNNLLNPNMLDMVAAHVRVYVPGIEIVPVVGPHSLGDEGDFYNAQLHGEYYI